MRSTCTFEIKRMVTKRKCYEVDAREDRIKSVKYFLNDLPSRSRSFMVKSNAVSGGQCWDGRNMFKKKSYASAPLILQIFCRRLAISCRTCVEMRIIIIHARFIVQDKLTTIICPSLGLKPGNDGTRNAVGIKRS